MPQKYITKAVFKAEDVIPYAGDYSTNMFVKDCKVHMGSLRYKVFKYKGTKCIACGRKATYVKLEKNCSQPQEKYHFNLYGKDQYGCEFMMTVDHIKPKAKGGSRKSFSNLQPMCLACNHKKADKY